MILNQTPVNSTWTQALPGELQWLLWSLHWLLAPPPPTFVLYTEAELGQHIKYINLAAVLSPEAKHPPVQLLHPSLCFQSFSSAFSHANTYLFWMWVEPASLSLQLNPQDTFQIILTACFFYLSRLLASLFNDGQQRLIYLTELLSSEQQAFSLNELPWFALWSISPLWREAGTPGKGSSQVSTLAWWINQAPGGPVSLLCQGGIWAH